MTNKQRIYKERNYVLRYTLDEWTCKYPECEKRATMQAHRIAQTEANIKKYGFKTINHNFNLVSACGLEHNAYWNIGNNPDKTNKIIDLIKYQGDEYLKTESINKYL